MHVTNIRLLGRSKNAFTSEIHIQVKRHRGVLSTQCEHGDNNTQGDPLSTGGSKSCHMMDTYRKKP